MENVKDLLKTSLEELEKVLRARSVVGEPMNIDGNTIIPLSSIGFGFGRAGARARLPKRRRARARAPPPAVEAVSSRSRPSS